MLNVGTLQVIFKMRDEVIPIAKKIDAQLKTTGDRVKQTGDRFKAAGMAMTVGLTAAVALLGGGAVKAYADFDSAMTKSMAIMTDVEGKQDSMARVARETALTSTFSAEETAEAYYFLASAGLSAEASMESLGTMAQFAQAGAFDMALATDLLTDAQSALGLSLDDPIENLKEMTHVGDVLVKANTIANASVEQFSKSLTTKAGNAMKQLNIDVESGVAVLAAWADQGVKGELAGERFAIVTRDLQKAAANNAQVWDDAGIAVFDANGKFNDMSSIIEQMTARLGPMSDEQKIAELQMLGMSFKSIDATKSLLGLSEKVREYEADLRGAGGTMETVSNNQLQSFSAQMSLAKAQITDVAIEFGGALVPAIEKGRELFDKLMPYVRDAVAWFKNLSPEVQLGAVAFAAVVAAAGPVLVVVGSIISAVGALLPVIGTMVTILTGPVGWVAALVALALSFKTTRDWVFWFVGAIKDHLMKWVDAVRDSMERWANVFGAVRDGMGKIGEKLGLTTPKVEDLAVSADKAAVAIEKVGGGVVHLAPKLPPVAAAVQTLDDRFAALDARLEGYVENQRLAEGATAAGQAAMERLDGEIDGYAVAMHDYGLEIEFTAGAMNGPTPNSLASASLVMSDAMTTVDQVFNMTMPTVNALGQEVDQVTGEANDFFDSIKTGIPLLDGLVKGFEDLWKGLTGGEGISGMLSNIGAGLAEGIGQLLSGGLASIASQALSWGIGFIKNLFGPDQQELEARNLINTFEQDVLNPLLDAGQLLESGGEQWAMTNIAIRDSYLALGYSAEEAAAMATRFTDAVREGPEAAAAVLAELAPIMDKVKAAMEATGLTMTELRNQAINMAAQMGISVEDAFDQIVAAAEAGEDVIVEVAQTINEKWSSAFELIGQDATMTGAEVAEQFKILAGDLGLSAELAAKLQGQASKAHNQSVRDGYRQQLAAFDLTKKEENEIIRAMIKKARQDEREAERAKRVELRETLKEIRLIEKEKRLAAKATHDKMMLWVGQYVAAWTGAASTISGLTFDPATGNVPSFATNPGEHKVVPGPLGAPMPAIVHGGEVIGTPANVPAETTHAPAARSTSSGPSMEDVVDQLISLEDAIRNELPDAMKQAARHGASTASRR